MNEHDNDLPATIEAVSFDLFGTLVAVDRPDDPAAAIAAQLESKGLSVPDDWRTAYSQSHADIPPGRERSLVDHVADALASRSGAASGPERRDRIDRAVRNAFDADVRTRPGAEGAVRTIGATVPIGVLSNCSVPGLVGHVLEESAIDERQFDAIVASVDCGWRKPHPRAFETIARDLAVDLDRLVHVGDSPQTDGGAEEAGARSLLVSDAPLEELPEVLEL